MRDHDDVRLGLGRAGLAGALSQALSHARRLRELDGMRGLAALLVVFYHFFARWAEPIHSETLYPHGNFLAQLPGIAWLGAYGVLLFFLISGFVIMLTLERSSGVADFALRRAARLWPAMLVCATLSALVTNVSGIAFTDGGEAQWHVTPFEYASSILFFPPGLVTAALDLPEADWVEGVYWTLWAEVRFYAVICLVFLIWRARFLTAWAVVQAASTAVDAARAVTPDGDWFYHPLVIALQPDHLAWFSLGLCGCMIWTDRRAAMVWVVAALAVTALLIGDVVELQGGRIGLAPAAGQAALFFAAVILPFALFLRRAAIMRALAWRPLLACGAASYPLYLFHERVSMTGFHFADRIGVPPVLGVVLMLAAVLSAAFAVHRYVERPGKSLMLDLGRGTARRLERRHRGLRFAG